MSAPPIVRAGAVVVLEAAREVLDQLFAIADQVLAELCVLLLELEVRLA